MNHLTEHPWTHLSIGFPGCLFLVGSLLIIGKVLFAMPVIGTLLNFLNVGCPGLLIELDFAVLAK
jgi:hypothetical protein